MKPFYILLFVFASFLPAASFGQYFTVDTFKGESPYHQMVSFIFPHLKNAANQGYADSITYYLIRDVLRIEPGQQKWSIFENVWGDKPRDIATTGDISFKVLNNDSAFFSMDITATTCTDTCVTWTRNYVFNSRDGKYVAFNELFSPEGMQALSDTTQKTKEKILKARIASLQDGVDNLILSDDDKKDYIVAIGLYNQCLQAPIANPSYSLDRAQVTVHIDRCLPHRLLFIDKIKYTYAFDMRWLRKYLTDYGKSLLQL